MNGRHRDYLRWPMPEAFVAHMRDEIGLSKEQRQIIDYVRDPGCPLDVGNDEIADHFMISRKRTDTITGSMFYALMRELFRLAYIGFETERRKRDQN